MKVGENRRPSIDDALALELLQLQEAAKIASIYHKGDPKFIAALMDETFHHVHHLIHRHRQEKDPTIADLPEARNPIFFVYPVCMFISLTLGILWILTKFLTRYPLIAPVGCAIGGTLMLLGGIYAMRHAEVHINLNEVSDEDLLNHPIFIHNFVLCIISIFGMILYSIQFWILFDYWRMLKNEDKTKSSDFGSSKSTKESNSSDTDNTEKSEEESDKQDMESVGKPYPIPALEALPFHSEVTEQNPEKDPVILYCCFVDCCNYIRNKYYNQKPTHEFQVIHVL